MTTDAARWLHGPENQLLVMGGILWLFAVVVAKKAKCIIFEDEWDALRALLPAAACGTQYYLFYCTPGAFIPKVVGVILIPFTFGLFVDAFRESMFANGFFRGIPAGIARVTLCFFAPLALFALPGRSADCPNALFRAANMLSLPAYAFIARSKWKKSPG